MKSHNEQLKEYSKQLKEWKKYKLNKIMESDAYRRHHLYVDFDNRLTKGTMYKYLFPDIDNELGRFLYEAFDDPNSYEDIFEQPSQINEVRKIQWLKEQKELHTGKNEEKAKKYEQAIKVEIGNFKHTAPDSYLSPDTLKILGITLQEVEETRTKKKRCQATVNYLIKNHIWFENILEEYVEGGYPPPRIPSKLSELESEYEQLINEQESMPMSMKKLALNSRIYKKYNELKIEKSEYSKLLRKHFDYLSNNIYDLKKKKYNGFEINSTKRLERIIQEFAWFYSRLFWADKEQYQEEQSNKRNAKRKKSNAFEERKKMIQKCKENGLNKTQAAKETGMSYPTVLKYWDLI